MYELVINSQVYSEIIINPSPTFSSYLKSLQYMIKKEAFLEHLFYYKKLLLIKATHYTTKLQRVGLLLYIEFPKGRYWVTYGKKMYYC